MWNRKQFLGWLIFLMAILGIGILLLFPTEPYGKFNYDCLGSEGDAFLFCKGGEISLLLYEHKGKPPAIDHFASYERGDGGWVVVNQYGKKTSIRCNVLWIEFRLDDGTWNKRWRVFHLNSD